MRIAPSIPQCTWLRFKAKIRPELRAYTLPNKMPGYDQKLIYEEVRLGSDLMAKV